MAITGSAFGEFDGINDVLIIPEPPDGVRRLVTSLRIINLDTVEITPTIRLRRVGVVPSGEAPFVVAFPDIALAVGREFSREKEIAVVEGFDLIAHLAAATTTERPIFHALWIDLA